MFSACLNVMCRANMNLLSARIATMPKKYQLLVFALVVTVVGSQAQPNTVEKNGAPHLVDMNNWSEASSDLDVASGLLGAPRGSTKQSSLTAVDKMVRVERSSSDTQLPHENVLGSASISQTWTTPATSTDYANDCRPRKSLEQAAISTMLTNADISVAMEMCTGINEELFTQLWSNSNFMNVLNNSTLPVASPSQKDDHVKGQNSRTVKIGYVTISHEKIGKVYACQEFGFLQTGMNLVLNSTNGTSVYVAAQKMYGAVYVTRLVLNSSLEDLTTILLTTAQQWRITGNSRAVSAIKGQHQMVISVDDVTVTLVRRVIGERVYYDMTVELKTREGVVYGGILGDLLMAKSASLATGPSSKTNYPKRCRPLPLQRQAVVKHKASFCTFMGFFLGLLEELAGNLPSTMFE